jgi:5-methylcytosine-specific restriction protein A
MARRIACDAAVTTVTVDGKGTPLDVGRTTRTIPPALRRAVVVRDGGCRFPGCDRPPEWTDCHHILPWAEGGATRLDNLVLLCQLCHTRVHEQGWRLQWGPAGKLLAEPP